MIPEPVFFLAACTAPLRTASVHIRELYRAYRDWCMAQQQPPLDADAFRRELAAAGYAVAEGRPLHRALNPYRRWR